MLVDMAGKTNYEMGLVDQYMELTAELFYDMRSVFLEKDEEKRVSACICYNVSQNLVACAR